MILNSIRDNNGNKLTLDNSIELVSSKFFSRYSHIKLTGDLTQEDSKELNQLSPHYHWRKVNQSISPRIRSLFQQIGPNNLLNHPVYSIEIEGSKYRRAFLNNMILVKFKNESLTKNRNQFRRKRVTQKKPNKVILEIMQKYNLSFHQGFENYVTKLLPQYHLLLLNKIDDDLNAMTLYQNKNDNPDFDFYPVTVPLFNCLHTNPEVSSWNLERLNIDAPFNLPYFANHPLLGVIDIGFDLEHQDLQIAKKFNTLTEEEQLQPSYYCTHGTNVCGVAAAIWDSSDGETPDGAHGVAQGEKLAAIQLAQIDYFNFAIALGWAVENRIPIINCSFSLGTNPNLDDTVLTNDIIEEAFNSGTLICASTGNKSNGKVAYPANHDLTIGVGASTKSGQRRNDSNYGTGLSVMAPGEEIRTTTDGGKYYWAGSDLGFITDFGQTSAACPHVAGLATSLILVNPDLSITEIRNIIERSCEKIGNETYNSTQPNGTWHSEYGHGRINFTRAVFMAYAICSNPAEYIGTRDISASYPSLPSGDPGIRKIINNEILNPETISYNYQNLADIQAQLSNGQIIITPYPLGTSTQSETWIHVSENNYSSLDANATLYAHDLLPLIGYFDIPLPVEYIQSFFEFLQ